MRNGMFAQSQLSTKCLLITKNSFLALEAAQLESNHKEILDKPKFRDILWIYLAKLSSKKLKKYLETFSY